MKKSVSFICMTVRY